MISGILKAVAETHEARAFYGGVDVQHAGEKRGLVGDDADGAAIEARETHHDIFREVLVDFEKFSVVGDRVDHVLDVVGLLRIFGDERVERRRDAVPGIAT